MDSFDYFQLVFDNPYLYLLSIVIVCVAYYYVYRRYYLSILDPFTYATFFSAMAVTVPVFLLFINQISAKLFFSFLATQGAFFAGFLMIKPVKFNSLSIEKPINYNARSIRFAKWFFIIIGVSNIIFQLMSYKLFGIPLFADSRLAVYGESGGISNLLKRLIGLTFQCYIFLTIFFLFSNLLTKSFKIYARVSAVIILIFSVLSGSKGAFTTFGAAFFIYAMYALRWGDKSLYLKIKTLVLKFGLAALIAALLIITLSGDSSNPLLFILFRIGQSGDVYYMAYPNNLIDKVPTMNWFIALFASPLALLHLIPRNMVPQPIGFFLMQYHNPSVEFKGPNPRMNIFSYVYMGLIYSPVYCFIIGFLASFIRNKLVYLLPRNVLGCVLYFLFLDIALKLEPDFYGALAELIDVVTLLPAFIILSYYMSLE